MFALVSSLSWSIFLISLCLCINARDIPTTLNVAFLTSKTATGGFDYSGTQSLAAMIMALNEVNNKTDGIEDDLLPDTTLRFIVRPTKRSFSISVNSAQYVAATAFNNQGVIAAIGPASLAGTAPITATALLFNEYNVLQISHGAYYSQLSYANVYNHLLRTIPSESSEGYALASIAYNHYYWKQYVVFHGLDYRSANTANAFQQQAEIYNINILGRVQFAPGESDFSEKIQNVLKIGAQIFVLLATYEDAAVLIHQGYHAGLFKEGTQILAQSSLNNYLLGKTLLSMNGNDEVIVKAMLRGMITLKYIVNGDDSDERKSFVKRFRSQKSTAGYRTASGALVCDQTLDGDIYAKGSNIYYLYEDYLNSSKSSKICAGYDFPSYFDEKGSNILATALYAYDAVHTLARGLHYLLYHTSLPLTVDNLKLSIINNVSYTGITGNVSFSSGAYGGLRYSEGDRYHGVKYEVYNFNPSYYDSLDSNYTGYVYVGTWETQNGFEMCDDSLDECHQLTYNTPDPYTPPLDAPAPIYLELDGSIRFLLYFISSLCMAISFLCAIALIVYKDSKVMKASQPVLLCFILIGAFFSGARSLVSSFDVSVTSCVSSMWTGHLAFLLTFMAIIAKSYRIHLLVNGKAFKRVKISTTMVLKVFLASLVVIASYLVLIMYQGQQHVQTHVEQDKLQYTYSYRCEDKDPYYQNLLFLMEGLMLGLGLYFSYTTRDAPDIINESTYIGLVTIMIAFIALVTFPAVNLLSLPFTVNQLLEGIVFGMSGIIVVSVLFVPKIFLLVAKGDIKFDVKIPKNLKRVNRTSSSPIKTKKGVSASIVPLEGIPEGIKTNPSTMRENMAMESIKPTDTEERIKFERQIQECFDQVKLWKEKKMILQQMYELSDFSCKESTKGQVLMANAVSANPYGPSPHTHMNARSLQPYVSHPNSFSHIDEAIDPEESHE